MTSDASVSQESYVPDDDSDDEWLRQSMVKRHLPRITLALGAVAVAAIAFMAGVLIEKNYFAGSGGSNQAASAGRFAALFRNGGSPTGGGSTSPGTGFAQAGLTIGQVKVIKGNSFYVTETSGNTLKVVLTSSSRLTAQKQVTAKELHPGDTVTVRGAAGKGGTIQATEVSIGTGGGGFGGLGGSGSLGSGATGFGGSGANGPGATGFGG